MLLQWLFLQIERYELKLHVHWKIKLLRVLYWNYLLDSIENNTKQTTVIISDRFLCVQWQTIPTRSVLVRWLQLQVYLWGCWKGRLQMLEQVSQSHRILVFWLLDCKKKILSQKFIIHKQVFGMSLKEGILFIFFLTLYHWGYDVSDRLSN